MASIIRWFTYNPVAANFLLLTVCVAGFAKWFTLRKEIFPELVIDAISVTVPYPNAAPEEVETGVCLPIEEAVADLQGVKRVRSTASQHAGSVMVEVESGFDVRDLKDRVKSRVDALDSLPEKAEKPVIEDLVIKYQVMSLAVIADTDEATLKHLAEKVRDDLLDFDPGPAQGFSQRMERLVRGKPKISQVETALVRPYEISVEIEEENLRRYGLSMGEIAAVLRRESVDMPGGSVRSGKGELVIRTVGKKFRGDELLDIAVATNAEGAVVKLRDVARVIDGFSDVELEARFDGERAMLVNVFRVGNEDTLTIARIARQYVEQSSKNLPPGVKLAVWNDQSVWLQKRMELLFNDGLQGLILVLVSIALFLRPKLAVLVALSIPAAFAVGVWMMPILGISINMISLFAFILVLGIVVDDAIIVGETVYTRIEAGEDPFEASWRGTTELGGVVTFGILTTCVAFTPMLGLSGVSGKIWPNIPWVVIPTLLGSLVLTKLVFPAHLATMKKLDRNAKRGPITRGQHWFGDRLEDFVKRVYQPSLYRILRWRYVTITLFLAALLLTGALVGMGFIKSQFMPEVEGDVLSAKLEMAQGVPFAQTQEAIKKLENAAREMNQIYREKVGHDVVKHILASAGTQPFLTDMVSLGTPQSSHLGEVTLELHESAVRGVPAQQLANEWRERAGPLAGAVKLTFRAETAAGGNAIDFLLTSSDLAQLERATAYVKSKLADYQGVVDISDSNSPGKDEWRLVKLTPVGESLGLRLDDVAMQLRDGFYGSEVQRFQRGRDEVKVMVRYTESERRFAHSLEEMKIRTRDGGEVPLLQVAQFERGRGPASIQRTDRERSIKVMADVIKTNANANEVVQKFTSEVLDRLSENFPTVSYDYEGEQKDQRESVREIGTKFLFSLLIMYVLIAIPLKSYVQPLIILGVIPFGVLGAVWGHVALGMSLSIMSMVGVVALAGVVVNDSLVMVDFINEYRDQGGSEIEAAELAGARRFRAIFLTSITTFLGLVPMLMEDDMQAKFLVPMAVSLGFGSLFATVIMLYLVPCIYLMLGDIKALLRNGRNRFMRKN
ncbi:MAG: hypothetical protein B9S37_07205 [Verrucomicrobiia bacterium Tous-C3TDCM]|nr:MAG: hypothetical protein B9S37_07205 [Verrucomicrobiae bacterium Tous-C3TDCM]PAZ06815.1 MAG: hypothetical protein CAK88_02640 [Verrucomicrobiae bacterium AMD-G2]